MSKRFNPSTQSLGFRNPDDPNFLGDLDPELLTRLQTNRCMIAQSQGDDATFSGAVKALLGIIPSWKRDEIEQMREDPEYGYVTWEDLWLPRTVAGWTLSDDPYNPTIINEPGESDYDPDFMATRYEEQEEEVDAENEEGQTVKVKTGNKIWVKKVEKGGVHWVSPILEEKQEHVDYYRLFTLIQEKLESAGLSWTMEQTTEEGGKIEKPIPPPTPTLKDGAKLDAADTDA